MNEKPRCASCLRSNNALFDKPAEHAQSCSSLGQRKTAAVLINANLLQSRSAQHVAQIRHHEAFLPVALSSCSAVVGLDDSSSSSLASLASLASFQSELRRLTLPGPRGSLGLASGLVGVARMLLILSVRPWPRSPLRMLRPSAFCLFA